MSKKDKLISNPVNEDMDMSGNAPQPITAPPIKLAVKQVPETKRPINIRRIETMDMPELPEPVNGEYYVVPLDAKGNEIIQEGFMIGKRTYDKIYSKLPDQFKVKKNPKS